MKVLMTLPLFLTLTAVALANPTPVDRAVLALMRNASEINIGLAQNHARKELLSRAPVLSAAESV
jgi:hypothetical protein